MKEWDYPGQSGMFSILSGPYVTDVSEALPTNVTLPHILESGGSGIIQ